MLPKLISYIGNLIAAKVAHRFHGMCGAQKIIVRYTESHIKVSKRAPGKVNSSTDAGTRERARERTAGAG